MFAPLFKDQQFTCPSSDGVFAYPGKKKMFITLFNSILFRENEDLIKFISVCFIFKEVCSTFYYNCTGGQSSIQVCCSYE